MRGKFKFAGQARRVLSLVPPSWAPTARAACQLARRFKLPSYPGPVPLSERTVRSPAATVTVTVTMAPRAAGAESYNLKDSRSELSASGHCIWILGLARVRFNGSEPAHWRQLPLHVGNLNAETS